MLKLPYRDNLAVCGDLPDHAHGLKPRIGHTIRWQAPNKSASDVHRHQVCSGMHVQHRVRRGQTRGTVLKLPYVSVDVGVQRAQVCAEHRGQHVVPKEVGGGGGGGSGGGGGGSGG